jgi:hypothetical protein
MVDISGVDRRSVEMLRNRGYLSDENELTDNAFLKYFNTFQDLACPAEIQNWATAFGIRGLRWKRAKDILSGESRCFAFVGVIVIRDGAQLITWFHEFAHAAFSLIPPENVSKLSTLVRESYRVVRNTDPDLEVPGMADGKYLEIRCSNGRVYSYFGLDHSGADGEDDELWAAIFALYCDRFEFPPKILGAVDEIISGLKARKAV